LYWSVLQASLKGFLGPPLCVTVLQYPTIDVIFSVLLLYDLNLSVMSWNTYVGTVRFHEGFLGLPSYLQHPWRSLVFSVLLPVRRTAVS